MKRSGKIFCLIFVLTFAQAGTLRAQEYSVTLSDVIQMLTYGFEELRFTGEFYFDLMGSTGGDGTLVIEDGSGKKFYARKFTCEEAYSETGERCSVSVTDDPPDISEEFVTGDYTLKAFLDDKVVYSLKFTVTIKTTDWGEKEECLSGGWKNLAQLNTSEEPASVGLFDGGPEYGEGAGADVQVLIFRDGEFAMKGHIEGKQYFTCVTESIHISLFSEDEQHLTKWVTADDFTDGDYELQFYKDGELYKTFPFRVEDGTAQGIMPEEPAEGLSPKNIFDFEGSYWLSAK